MSVIFQSFTIIHLLHPKLLKTGRRVHITEKLEEKLKTSLELTVKNVQNAFHIDVFI